MRLLKIYLIICSIAYGQTIDYFPKSFYGNLAGAAGSGLAIIEGVNAVQINPAGIGRNNNTEILIQLESEYYSYQLLNYLHNKNVGRTFYQNRFKPIYPRIFVKSQIKPKLGLGIGITYYLSPFLINSKRAVTWSPLYNQTTMGVIRAAIFGMGYNINENTHFGINVAKYWGVVNSSIEGENHYLDLGKTLHLETKLSSWNFNFGTQLKFENIDIGFNISTENKFKIETNTILSKDSLYQYLIPLNNEPILVYPINFNLGIAFSCFQNWQVLFDVKSYNINQSEFSFNIYDYGGNYTWQNNIGFSTGLIFSPQINKNYKFGYSYRPQVKTIEDISEDAKDLFGIFSMGQSIKHIFTIGSNISISRNVIDYGVKYSILNWQRNYESQGYQIEDDYSEKDYSLFINIIFKIN